MACALALLCLLAWAYLLAGAGTGMSALSMSGLWPATDRAAPAGMGWTPTFAALIALMWVVMMVAMMLPSAAPMILLYGRVTRHGRKTSDSSTLAPVSVFAAGYLLIWALFGVVATALQYALDTTGALSRGFMASQSTTLSAALLVFAGLYQLTPLKAACLVRCRSPAALLARYRRPGRLGALRAGASHGAYCVGCCAALMALLFVGGVMNMVWVAGLALLVALEKLAPGGRHIGLATAGALIVAGLALLLLST